MCGAVPIIYVWSSAKHICVEQCQAYMCGAVPSIYVWSSAKHCTGAIPALVPLCILSFTPRKMERIHANANLPDSNWRPRGHGPEALIPTSDCTFSCTSSIYTTYTSRNVGLGSTTLQMLIWSCGNWHVVPNDSCSFF
jgi:hypothetical protein